MDDGGGGDAEAREDLSLEGSVEVGTLTVFGREERGTGGGPDGVGVGAGGFGVGSYWSNEKGEGREEGGGS